MFKYLFKKLENFFIWSSGADSQILEKVPTEKSKYFGIGGTIVFTALMASFAGGYAFFTAFKSVNLSIPFGLFWGSLIFNLDRYIVASFGIGDGKKTISRQELRDAAPRLAMAIVLGFVISTPSELKLFEKEIQAKIDTDIAIVQKGIDTSAITDPQILSYKRDIKEIEVAMQSRDDILTIKKNDWGQKVNSIRKTKVTRNDKTYWKENKDDRKLADDASADYSQKQNDFLPLNDSASAKLLSLQQKIVSRDSTLLVINSGRHTIQAQNDGLLARLQALSELTSKSSSLLFAKWLITILFIFIEIAPILFKMMTERGPYDDIVDSIKHEVKVKQMQIQSNLNQEINTEVKIHTEKYEQKLNAELESNKEILAVISKAQQEIAIQAIEQWKEEQKQLLQKNGTGLIVS
jgi:hypothetical protein